MAGRLPTRGDSYGRGLLRLLGAAVVLAVVALAGAWLYARTALHGFSARAQPSAAEKHLAMYARAMAVPAGMREAKNPVVLTPAVMQEAMAHYADHCATCHANNGSGNTMLGQGMYPKPPDLRSAESQARSDGEIFSILENGIRLSGMPAFGGSDDGTESWKLVYFLRHLPSLTAAEEAQMERMNPRSPQEMQEEADEDRFLNGDGRAAKKP